MCWFLLYIENKIGHGGKGFSSKIFSLLKVKYKAEYLDGYPGAGFLD